MRQDAIRTATVTLPAVCWGSEVIAADDAIDQSAGAANGAPDASVATQSLTVGIADLILVLVGIALVILFLRRGWLRLRDAPARPIAFTATGAAALFVGFLIFARLGAAIAFRVCGITVEEALHSLDAQAKITLGTYLAQGVMLLVFARLQALARRPLIDLRPSPAQCVGIGAITLVLVYPVVAAVSALVGWIVRIWRGGPSDVVAHETLRLFTESSVGGWYIGYAAMIVLITPIIEETLYRGVLQEGLLRAGLHRWPAIMVTSAVFALVHVGIASPEALPTLFVLSLALGWAYEKTGRLWTSMTIHGLFNAVNLGLAVLMA